MACDIFDQRRGHKSSRIYLANDQYRSIRFLPERALWRGEKLPFEAQFCHRGFFYKKKG